MFAFGGAVQDPNKRDSIMRAKRRRLERRLSTGLMAVMVLVFVVGVLALVHGLVTGNAGPGAGVCWFDWCGGVLLRVRVPGVPRFARGGVIARSRIRGSF